VKATRRELMAGGVLGALAVPTVAGLASWRWRHGEGAVLLHDPSLAAGRRFAEAGRAAGGQVLALEGDAIRLAQQVLAGKPALIAGVSRHAEALLVEEAAAEAGYRRVVALEGRARGCTAAECRPGWRALGRMAEGAGDAWAEALAEFALHPRASVATRALPDARPDPAMALGWLLARS
jgi:hypothetical protein